MILNTYSIYDSAAKAYIQPFFMHNDGLAIRAFQGNVNSTEENNISKYPDQFTLYKIGTFDDQTATITPEDPISLGNGLTFQETPTIITPAIEAKLDKLLTYYDTPNKLEAVQ
jgi:hypothetical protein